MMSLQPNDSQTPADVVQIQRQIDSHWPFARWSQHGVIVACSGGVDSTALLHLLCELGGRNHPNFHVAHVNHGLRGEEGERDASEVERMAGRFGVPYHHLKLGPDDLNCHGQVGLEGQARAARYEALATLAAELGARYLVTAHTQNDQVETILHRIIRGTGIDGLRGMRCFREYRPGLTIARPLLEVTREQLETYVQHYQLPTCSDSTNVDPAFTRNRIRQQLVPMLKQQFNSQVEQAVLRLGTVAADYQNMVETMADAVFERLAQLNENGAIVDTRFDEAISLPVMTSVYKRIWRSLGWPERDMQFDHWRDLALLTQQLQSKPGFEVEGELSLVYLRPMAGSTSNPESHSKQQQRSLCVGVYPGSVQVIVANDRIELKRPNS